MQALAETLVLERLLDSWALTYISPKLMLTNLNSMRLLIHFGRLFSVLLLEKSR